MADTKIKNCKQCGVGFAPIQGQLTCGDECARIRRQAYDQAKYQRRKQGLVEGARLQTVTGNCANCGRMFSRLWRGSGNRPTTCGKACQKAKWDKAKRCDRSDYYPLHVRKEIAGIRSLARQRHRSLSEIKAKRFVVLVRKHREATHCCVKCSAPMPRTDLRLRVCGPCTKSQVRAQRTLAKARRRAMLRQGEPVDPIRVFERDGWRCHLCNKQTIRGKRGTYHDRAPELDHIVPLSKGGQHTYANTACACRKCNIDKSDRIIGQPSLLAA